MESQPTQIHRSFKQKLWFAYRYYSKIIFNFYVMTFILLKVLDFLTPPNTDPDSKGWMFFFIFLFLGPIFFFTGMYFAYRSVKKTTKPNLFFLILDTIQYCFGLIFIILLLTGFLGLR